MIDYETLKAKEKLQGDSLRAVLPFYDGLNEINDNNDSKLKGKLKKYIDAIKCIRYKGRSTKAELESALNTMEGFGDFLLSADGIFVYKTLLDEGPSNGLEEAELDAGIKAVSDYLDLKIDIPGLKEKAKAYDEPQKESINTEKAKDINAEKVNAPENTEPLDSAEKYEKLTEEGKTFASFGSSHKSVTNLLSELSFAKDGAEERVDKATKQKNRGLKYSEEELTRDKAFAEEVKKYHDDINVLSQPLSNVGFDTNARQKALDHLKGLQSFLEDGLPETNLNRIIKLSAEGGPGKSIVTHENNLLNGLKALEQVLHFGIEPAKARELNEQNKDLLEKQQNQQKRETEAKNDRRSADKWIEQNWKSQINNNIESVRSQKGYPQTFFAGLLATRDLAGAKRGSLSSIIRSYVGRNEIRDRAKEFMEKPGHMKDFLNKLATDKKLLAKAEKAAGKGHGGGIDDLFKDYLKNLPAGNLHNDQALARYMPTVQERIEALQTQAKKLKSTGFTPDAQAAEIVILRNMIKAERKVKDSLDHPIPTGGRDLSAETNKVVKSVAFKELLSDRKIGSLITKGHGGEMLTEMRKAYSLLPDRTYSEEAENALNEGSFGGRITQIKEEAGKLKERLNNLKKNLLSDDVNEVYDLSRKLIAENIALCKYFSGTGANSSENIPWKKIYKLRDSMARDEKTRNVLYPNGYTDDKDIEKRLDQIIEAKGIYGFYDVVQKDVEKYVEKKNLIREEESAKEKIASLNDSTRKSVKSEISEDEFNSMFEDVQKMVQKLSGADKAPNKNTQNATSKNKTEPKMKVSKDLGGRKA